MQLFNIILRNDKLKTYRTLNWIIIFTQVCAFIFLALFAAEKKLRVASISTLILISICFGLRYYFRNSKWALGFYPFFLVCWTGWLTMGLYWFAGVSVLLAIFGQTATRMLTVFVSNSEIRYPSIPMKFIKWHQLNNVMVKDGMLTIDFKNNRIIQQEVDAEKTTIDEKEFNEFCKERLSVVKQ